MGTLPGSSATSGPYGPGDKSQFARFKIEPANSFTTLPPQLSLLIFWSYSPETDLVLSVWDDYVAIGDASGPITSNFALNVPLHGSNLYYLDTLGLNVSTLNSGGYYLYLGVRADPTSYSTGAYSFAYSGSGTHDNNGTTSAWTGAPPYANTNLNARPLPCHSDETGTLTVTASGPGSFLVADVTVTTTATAIAVDDLMNPTSVCSAIGTNGYGGSQSVSGHFTQSASLATTKRVRINLSGGSGTTSVDAHARADCISGSASGRASSSVTVSAAAVVPTSVDVTISTLLLSAPSTGGVFGPMGWGLQGAIATQDEPEMTTLYLGDTLTFWAQLSQYSTGAVYDATGSVSYRVYEETTDTPVLTGTLAVQDDSNTIGFYRGQISVSPENGFEIGKSYCVRVGATVDSVAQAGMVERFVVRASVPTATSIAAAVWAALDPGDASGRASSLGGMLRQIWSYCFNRNSIQGSLQSVYRDDSSTVMLQGAQSASDTTADRGRMA